jgi:hypothetical protein
MALLSISSFQTANIRSTAHLTLHAPFDQSDWDQEYDFQLLTQTLAERRTESKVSDYQSFHIFDDEHSAAGHAGATLLQLGYTREAAESVREILVAGEIAHLEIEIAAKRKDANLFAFPLVDLLNHSEVTRAASLLADCLDIKGVLPNSYLSTYFFRFAIGAKVTKRNGNYLGRDFIEEHNGVFVQIAKYLA